VIPPLADSKLASAIAPDATLRALRGRHVLIYFAAAGRMRLMIVAGGEPRASELAVDLHQLDRLIEAFRRDPQDPATAGALGRALLPPGALPPAPARIHIIPTGPLLRVSFAALRVSGQRLLDGHEIVYAPSVTGLAAMTAERGDHAGDGAVLADTRSDLRHAASELEIVVDRTGATAHLGASAKVAALRASARRPLLHVISHSGLGLEGGYLALADGKVTAADILTWRVGPRLVVLPTCASASTAGREMWGSLAAAFLAAGSSHVVATVTSVEDSIGLEFSRLFYAAGGAQDPIAATARAQREMAARLPVAAWSSFVVLGL
jgi:CHAT domain-containing protein